MCKRSGLQFDAVEGGGCSIQHQRFLVRCQVYLVGASSSLRSSFEEEVTPADGFPASAADSSWGFSPENKCCGFIITIIFFNIVLDATPTRVEL